MTGILTNPLAIILGASIGIMLRRLVTNSISKTCEQALGFCTLVIAIKMSLHYESILLLIFCVAVGGIIGTIFQLQDRIETLANQIQKRLHLKKGKFSQGFTTASILYCTGAMAVIGSINSGVAGDNQVLYAKSLIDGISSATFSAIYGAGVAFSAIPVLLYQGGIALLASRLKILSEPHVLNEISAVGGVLILMIGSNFSFGTKIRVGDFIPAILLVMSAAICGLI